MSIDIKIKNYIEENWNGTIRNITEDTDTLIGMPYPYSVSGFGTVFQEMYYWGTYFTNAGLIIADRVNQAKNNVENMIYLVKRFGFVPNANRTWGLTRSQPPFLSQMVREIYDVTKDTKWLEKCYDALCDEYSFWQTKRMTECGLNTYSGEYPDKKFLCGRLCARFKIDTPKDEETIEEYAKSFHTGCESGWDFSSRCGLLQHHYAWLCLNSLLYGVEKNMEYFSSELKNSNDKLWLERAEKRKALINKLMWNEKLGLFSDYNLKEKKTSDFISPAMLYPLFTGLATEDQARATMEKLNLIELEYGLTCCPADSVAYNLQWDFPHVWPPLQLIAVKALIKYGYEEDAKRIAKKYLRVAEINFEKHGRLWEKYNGVDGEISVTKEYTTPPMMGWSASIYLYFDKLIRG